VWVQWNQLTTSLKNKNIWQKFKNYKNLANSDMKIVLPEWLECECSIALPLRDHWFEPYSSHVGIVLLKIFVH